MPAILLDIHPYDNHKFTFNRFDCGNKALNQFIKNSNGAKKTSRRYEKKVFVAIHPGSTHCIGYFALELNSDTVPSDSIKVIKGLEFLAGVKATFARPKDRKTVLNSVHLFHLAVHNNHQNQGYGKYMMQDIFEKIAVISENVGFTALTLQSVDDVSTKFYQKIGFETYVEGKQPKMLYPVKNILKLLESQS